MPDATPSERMPWDQQTSPNLNRPTIVVELNPWCPDSQRYCLDLTYVPPAKDSPTSNPKPASPKLDRSFHGAPEAAEKRAKQLVPDQPLAFTYRYRFTYDANDPAEAAYFKEWNVKLRPTIESRLPVGSLTIKTQTFDPPVRSEVWSPQTQRLADRDRSDWSPLDAVEETGHRIKVIPEARPRRPLSVDAPTAVAGTWHWVPPFPDMEQGIAYQYHEGDQTVRLLVNPEQPLSGPLLLRPQEWEQPARQKWLEKHGITLDTPAVPEDHLRKIQQQYWNLMDRVAWQQDASRPRPTTLEYAGTPDDNSPLVTWYVSEVTTNTHDTTWVLWKGDEVHVNALNDDTTWMYVRELVTNAKGVPTFASIADAETYAHGAGALCELYENFHVQKLFDAVAPETIHAIRPPSDWKVFPVGEQEAVIGRYHPSHDRLEILTRRDRPLVDLKTVAPAPDHPPTDDHPAWQLQAIDDHFAIAFHLPWIPDPEHPEKVIPGSPVILRNPQDAEERPLLIPRTIAEDPARRQTWLHESMALPEGFAWQAPALESQKPEIPGTWDGPVIPPDELTPDLAQAIQAEQARIEHRHPWNAPWVLSQSIVRSRVFPGLCAERGLDSTPSVLAAGDVPLAWVPALERAYANPGLPLARPTGLPQPPPPTVDDPKDPRWRLVRPASAERWLLVRPETTPKGLRLTTLYTDARQTEPRWFSREEIEPTALAAWADKHHLTLHPDRIDETSRIPTRWRGQIAHLVQTSRIKVATAPVQSTAEDPQDPRWRLVRPTPAERWMLVRPRRTAQGLRLETVYQDATTQKPQAFTTADAQPTAIAAWAERHNLGLHPERIDDPHQIPPAWKAEFVRLFKAVGTPRVAAPGSSPSLSM